MSIPDMHSGNERESESGGGGREREKRERGVISEVINILQTANDAQPGLTAAAAGGS